MKLKEFDFSLPPGAVARFPATRRDESRLLRLDRKSGAVSHHRFHELPDLLSPEDFLIMNNSRVVPARLLGRIDGKAADLLVIRDWGGKRLEALCRPAFRFKVGAVFMMENGPRAEVVNLGRRGRRGLLFDREYDQVLEHGFAPLPPYIKRKAGEAVVHRDFDLERYQTIYAGDPGSIAAPTAGLHFSPAMMDRLRRTHPLLEITLEVGEATFQKIETEDIGEHRMGREKVRIKAATGRRIAELKREKGKLVAVGTTSVRSLESFALLPEPIEEFDTELFISPGFRFRLVDKLLTNFHLPRSSLFILAAAFAGLDLLKETYRQAITEKYRFFSYGDAMLIV